MVLMPLNRRTRNIPTPVGGDGGRRASSKKVRYLSVVLDNCELNIDALIERARSCSAFGPVEWQKASWDVTASERGRMRSHRASRALLHFTQHLRRGAPRGGGHVGEPFDNGSDFADIVKALVRCRREIGGQNYVNQNDIIRAFRYLYDELDDRDHDLRAVTREHLDRAAAAIKKRETPVSAYKQTERLEEVARLIDDNGLAPLRLDWHCSFKRRPPSMSDSRFEDPAATESRKSKMPQDGILEAVGELYKTIPKECWADRIRVCFVSILVMTGFRIGELLTLPARPVETEPGTDRKYLVYYPEKGAPPDKKWLLTASGELVEGMVNELLELTAPARAVAAWLHRNPGQVYLDGGRSLPTDLSLREVADLVGLNADATNTSVSEFLRPRGISAASSKSTRIPSRDLIDALSKERFDFPVTVVKKSGKVLNLKDALACVFRNAFHPGRPTLKYVVVPIGEGQIADFLGAKADGRSVFDRYDIRASDGSPLRVASHAFRHWLNDQLDRGGLSDIEQARYFGRRNTKDNRAYQHMTQADRTRRARSDLQNGGLLGPVADIAARMPVNRKEAYLEARVRAVHVTPGGLCLHDFSGSPCPNHMACKNGCGDFHWARDDAVQLRELTFEESVVAVAIEAAKAEMDEESWGADSWLKHNEEKLRQLRRCLADCGGSCGAAGDA